MTPRSQIVCECLRVTQAQLLAALKRWAPRTLKEMIRRTGAGEGCTACHPALRSYLEKLGACANPSSLPSPAVRSDSSQALSA